MIPLFGLQFPPLYWFTASAFKPAQSVFTTQNKDATQPQETAPDPVHVSLWLQLLSCFPSPFPSRHLNAFLQPPPFTPQSPPQLGFIFPRKLLSPITSFLPHTVHTFLVSEHCPLGSGSLFCPLLSLETLSSPDFRDHDHALSTLPCSGLPTSRPFPPPTHSVPAHQISLTHMGSQPAL